jgi:hypothetical protein
LDGKSTCPARDVARFTMPESLGEKEEHEAMTMPKGDLPGYEVTVTDLKLMDVYGDYIHQNDGSQLDGDIKDDAAWQSQ